MEYDLFAARRRSLAQPGHDPAPGDLAQLSPLGWEHINLNGGLPLGNIADPRSRPIPAAPHRRTCSRLACLKFRFVSSPLYTQHFGGGGVLATAGGLVFSGDGAGNLAALDAATGAPLWGARTGNITNAPQTYTLDGHQYLIAAAGDTVYSFLLN
jgi:hypothetical protein